MLGQVLENGDERQFQLPLPEGEIAFISYRVDDEGRLVLTHTQVPSEFSGLGVGTHLAKGAFEIIERSGRKIVLLCPFLQVFFRNHPEYAGIIAG